MTTALLFLLFTGQGVSEPGLSATELFKKGDLGASLTVCSTDLRTKPGDAVCLELKARLLLYKNRLAQAETLLRRALAKNPTSRPLELLEAELQYRRGNFQDAARYFRSGGRILKAKQLEAFGARKPYASSGRLPVSVPFINTDPLPLVRLTVNGKSGNFLVDTGGAQVVLDPDFAASIGVFPLSSESGTFAGDRKAAVGLGMVDSIDMAGLRVANVPVQLLGTTGFRAAANGLPVDGVIGTELLYHFAATLDFPSKRLILAAHPSEVAPRRVPFWLAGDHFIVSIGHLGKSADHLFLVDTGLAGAAFTGPTSTLVEAGMEAPRDLGLSGVGGGGVIKTGAFPINEFNLGPISRSNLTGVYGAFPASLEESLGFHLAGIVSHQFFRPFRVTFDFKAMEILVSPSGAEEPK